MTHASPVSTLALAIGLGGSVALICQRLRIPAILPLLGVGMAAGHFGLVEAQTMEGGLRGLVGVVVALLIFEGSLLLDKGTLKHAPRAVRGLLTVGVVVGWGLTIVAAHLLLRLTWGTSAVLGAVLIVTGPTVVAPLLRRVRLLPSVHGALLGEGILVDPIGVVAAVVTLEAVLLYRETSSLQHGWTTAWHYLQPFIGGSAVGLAMGLLISLLARLPMWSGRHGDRAVVALCSSGAFVGVGLAEALDHEGGLVAAAAMGLVMARLLGPRLPRLRDAMEDLAAPLVGTLFILLASGFDLGRLMASRTSEFVFVGALMFAARPLAVMAATFRSRLSGRERAFVALVGPRGVVAVSAASLASTALANSGEGWRAEAATLSNATLLVVICTVAWSSIAAPLLARALGVRGSPPNGVLIVGAHGLGRALARKLADMGVEAALVDRNAVRVEAARTAGLQAFEGDATDLRWIENQVLTPEAGFVLAMTGNVDVDGVVSRWACEHFGPGHGAKWPPIEVARRLSSAPPPLGATSDNEVLRVALGSLERDLEFGTRQLLETDGVVPGALVYLRDGNLSLEGGSGAGWASVVVE